MKTKIYLLILFFSGFSGFAFSPPVITNPTSLEVCDQNNDGVEAFDLTVKIPEVLGALNPSDYSVTFHETQTDAIIGANPISNIGSYININPFFQTVYIRVSENVSGDYSTTSLQLIVNQKPIINPNLTNFYISDSPFDGFGVFDLTTKDAEIVFGATASFVTYYPSISDAANGTNQISNPTAYTNFTNPQTIGVRVTNAVTGCYQTGSFQLIVSDGLPIVTPNEYRICDVGNDTNESFDLTSKNEEILGNLNPALYTVNYYTTSQDAVNDVNSIPSPAAYILSVSIGTVYARVFENANPSNFANTSLGLKIVPMPIGTISGPSTVCQGELAIMSFQATNSAPPFSFYYNINGVAAGIASASLGNNVSVYINTNNVGTYTYDLVAVLSQNEAYCYNPQSGSFTVQVLAAPTIVGNVPDISVPDIPYDGIATFNLTFYENIILTNQTGATITYYTNQFDAQAQSSPIINPSAYVATNGQEIWFRLNYPSGCPLISSFNLYTTNPDIVFIPDANFKAKLIALGVDTNSDGEIQVIEASGYWNNQLDVSNSNISDLTGIKSFTNIGSLNCSFNQLTTLDIANMNAPNSVALSINCSNNLLTEIVFENNLINDLDCSNNNLTNFNFNGSNITILSINYNPLSANLDFSSLTNLVRVDIVDAQFVESINIKTGRNTFPSFAGGMPSLRHICCEESNVTIVNNQLVSMGYVNAIASSYCSFTPGGNYNTITGTVTFDANNNGCDGSDVVQPNIRININDGTIQGAIFTNATGNYTFYTQTGSFALSPAIENPSWYNFSPTSAIIPFANNNNNISTQDFCLAANGIHRDVEMVIVPITPARPGFDAEYKLVYRNKGNQTVDVIPSFTYNDAVLDLVNTSVAPTQTNVGGLSWFIPNVLPFQSGSIDIVLNVNAPTEIPAVNNGDLLTFTSFVDITGTDENWSDNSFTLNQTVVGSFDPNDITCLEGAVVSPTEIGNYLHYNIRFENTGTAPAEFIVVKVEVNETDFDINSLQIMNSSNPVYARINRNIVEFVFQNIQLQAGGHGNILLKIKSKNNLLVGDEVNKKANIYFDYNFPIETNDAETIFQTLNNSDFENDASISVYPNPSNGIVFINCDNSIKSVQLYDIQGRLLQTNLTNDNQINLDISSQSNGVYFLKITSEKGIGVQKIIKE